MGFGLGLGFGWGWGLGLGLGLGKERPPFRGVLERAEQLEASWRARVVLKVGEHQRIEEHALDERERHPLLLHLRLGHHVTVAVGVQDVARSLHAVARGEHLGAHIVIKEIETVLKRCLRAHVWQPCRAAVRAVMRPRRR